MKFLKKKRMEGIPMGEEKKNEKKQNEEKQNDKKKKKKSMDSDTITVLAILGALIVIGVVLSLFGVTQPGKALSGAGMNGQHETHDRSSSIKIIVACTLISLFFICLFIIKKIRDKKRKIREQQLEKARKLRELEEARKRVQQAKMDEFLKAGQGELNRRKKEEELLKRGRRDSYPRRDYPDDRPYVRRDLNQFKDDDEEEEFEYEAKENFFEKILRILRGLFVRDSEDDLEDYDENYDEDDDK
jgi:predicted nucleic acid-binding Zn ribbon protein